MLSSALWWLKIHIFLESYPITALLYIIFLSQYLCFICFYYHDCFIIDLQRTPQCKFVGNCNSFIAWLNCLKTLFWHVGFAFHICTKIYLSNLVEVKLREKKNDLKKHYDFYLSWSHIYILSIHFFLAMLNFWQIQNYAKHVLAYLFFYCGHEKCIFYLYLMRARAKPSPLCLAWARRAVGE